MNITWQIKMIKQKQISRNSCSLAINQLTRKLISNSLEIVKVLWSVIFLECYFWRYIVWAPTAIMNKKYFRLRSCHCKISGICRQIHTINLPVGKVLDDHVKRRGTLLGVALRYDRGRCDQIVPRDSSKRRLRPQTQAMVGNHKPSRFQLPKYTFNDFWLIVYIFYCEVHLARCFDVKLVNSF